jgi:putative DNA primase/helicase
MSREKIIPFDRPPTDPPPDGLLLNPKDPRKSARAWMVREHLEGRVWFIDGQFYLWDTPVYRVLTTHELRARLGAFLEKTLKAVSATNASVMPFQPTREDVGLVVDALQQLTYSAAIGPSWLEPSEWLPTDCTLCANGILHIPTGRLLPPTPTFFSVNALTFAFDADAPEPIQWLRFLDTLWPDDPQPIALLQEWFGYQLTPDTRYQKMLVIIGPMRSGKGTIVRILQRLLGVTNVCSPTLTALGQQFGRQVFIGKTAAIFPDAKISGRMDTAAIVEALLSISGEDQQTIPRKNIGDWTGALTVRFTILTNEPPRMDDASGALVSRMLLLPLIETFLGREDLALTEKLVTELPGILNWAREGWLRLRARGRFLDLPLSDDMRDDLRELNSPIHAFIADWCDRSDETATIARRDLFAGYQRWCKEQGRDHPGTEQQFGQRLNAAFPAIRSTRPRTGDPSRPRYYTGIDLVLSQKTRN